MPFQSDIYHIALVLQAAGAVLTAMVVYGFYRLEPRRFLLQWTRSWIALSANLIAAALGFTLDEVMSVGGSGRLLLAVVSLTGGYLHLAFLLFGTYELARGKAPSANANRIVIGASIALGIATALLFSLDGALGQQRFFARYAVASLVGGAAYIAAALGVLRTRNATRAVGLHLVSGAFFVYGVQQLHYFAIAGFTTWMGQDPVGYAAYLGFFDLLIHTAMALGMVTWLLEDERGKTILAAMQIEHLAYHDTLTGLPNRRLFLDHLGLAVAHAQRSGRMVGIFFLDLDRFKIINDSLGHAIGDKVLQAVAQRIRTLLRTEDTVARLGGDEFIILAPEVRSVEDVATIARKVRHSIKQPIVVEGRDLFVTTSIGVSLYPADSADPETLLKNADTAMYRAKARGTDGIALYTRSMHERAVEQLALENALWKAHAGREFVLHFQPILATGSNVVTGVESVIRWQHPQRGLLAPNEFIAAAEATGLIVPLGDWVLRSTCKQLAEWQRAGHDQLHAAVNLSVRQLQQADFVAAVRQILEEHQVHPSSLELEITETIAMQSNDGTVEKLRELKRLGCRISIDDFGTGYSSLSALKLFPVDALKIDVSFVRDIAEAGAQGTIASAVINLAQSLRLQVIAEGVETAEQLAFLEANRCDFWQGYLASAPVGAAECGELLAGRKGKISPSLGAPAVGVRR